MDENLKIKAYFQDKDTYDIDKVVVAGYNRKEIMQAITELLTIKGVKMYGRVHRWTPKKGKKDEKNN